MAGVKFSALVSEMKGKLNGSIFALNQGGQYVRNRRSGGGVNSKRWQLEKGRFSFLASRWRSLTASQKSAWQAITSQYPTTDRFGNERFPSGYELWMRLNGTLIASGLTVISEPVNPAAFEMFGPISLVQDLTTPLTLELNNQTPGGYYGNIFASPQLSPGKTRIPTRWRLLKTVDISSGTEFDISAEYAQAWGPLVNGMRIVVKVVEVIEVSGQQGNEQSAFIIVQA